MARPAVAVVRKPTAKQTTQRGIPGIVGVMVMRPRLRKLVLVAHVTTSVGWIGAVVVFLVLIVVGMTSRNPDTTRAVYLVLKPAG